MSGDGEIITSATTTHREMQVDTYLISVIEALEDPEQVRRVGRALVTHLDELLRSL